MSISQQTQTWEVIKKLSALKPTIVLHSISAKKAPHFTHEWPRRKFVRFLKLRYFRHITLRSVASNKRMMHLLHGEVKAFSKARNVTAIRGLYHCVLDIIDIWSSIFPVSKKIQISNLLPWVIATQILRISSQKYCILFSFYGRGTSTCTFVTHDSTDCDNQGHVVSKREVVGSSVWKYIKSRYLSISQQIQTWKLINKEIASTQTCHSMKTLLWLCFLYFQQSQIHFYKMLESNISTAWH